MLTLIQIVFCPQLFSLELSRGPYLQNSTENSIVIRWRTDLPSSSQVSYGTDPHNLDQSINISTISTEHEVALIGLAENQKYFYAVGDETTTLESGNNNHFKTHLIC